MYIKQILFVVEGLVRVLGGESELFVSTRLYLKHALISVLFLSAGKVGQNPQSQTTQAG